ncbi:hypothetical protein LWI29_035591 [Acer saccharum]|uniref:Disease resistance protein At4g27190-like leucine-rich repeats domain-containing protein n=1 Tax=Acer saccharum TaxID=4024 RepID=A0AA39W051_ACESA|nr:hypothetical protein LWI29_035591 [Acer saccharum]
MDLVSPIFDILTRLWDCTAQRRAYISHFEQNLESLRNAMKELKAVEERVALNVEREVQQDCYLKCAERVEIWLDDVKEINNQVFGIVERGYAEAQNKCFGEQGRMQGIMPDCFRNLRYLHIENCSIKDLAWLRYSIYLRYLWVDNCPSLEEIIADDFGSSEIEENMDILSKIESINLVSLPSLKSICRRAVLFPCLQNLEVINCPSLRKLPFESGSAERSLKAIKGSKTWWDQLEWDDAATKDAFASKFIDSDFVLFKPTVHSDYTKNLLQFKRGC